MADITMPQLGETVTEGTITKWFKQVGDPVAIDEVLFEVSTDKVDSEVTSTATGFLAEIRVPEGDTVDVGVVLAVVSSDVGAPVAAVVPVAPAPVVEFAPAPVVEVAAVVVAAPVAEVAPVVVAVPVVDAPASVMAMVAAPVPSAAAEVAASTMTAEGMEKVLSPVVRKLINENDLDPTKLVGTGIGGRVTREDVLAAIDAGSARRVASAESAIAVSSAVAPVAEPAHVAAPPAVPVTPEAVVPVSVAPVYVAPIAAGAEPAPAAVAAEPAPAAVAAEPAPAPVAGIVAPAPDPEAVAPAPAPPAPAPPAPAPPAPAPPASAAPAPVASAPAPIAPTQTVVAVPAASAPALRLGPRDEAVPFNNIRRRTGEHMVMSLHTAPHAFIAVEVDYSGIDKVRAAKKEAFKADEGFSLTYLPFIARAVIDAMRTYPHVNASVVGDSLVVHHAVHLGVAVDLDFNGLMVPVVRDADGKRMRAIARDVSDLAARARSKKLTPDDISGGTFTLSNAGPYGIDLMQSVINQPQVGILSITSVSKKPVVVTLPDGADTIGIRPVGMLGLSWDHRAFDGAYAASFLSKVKDLLQTREWAAEL